MLASTSLLTELSVRMQKNAIHVKLLKRSMKMDITIRKLTGQEIETALRLAWEVFQEFEAADYSDQGTKKFYHSIHEAHWLSLL